MALAGIDDTVVLFRERPVAVVDLWRRIFATAVERPCASLTVVHPSRWAGERVATLVDAAATVATEVRAHPESAVHAACVATAVIDITDDGITVLDAVRTPVVPTPEAATAPPRRHWRGPVFVATGMALTLCAIGATAARTRAPVPTPDAVSVVEGRITLRIPPQWVVTRITAGPGSRRIRAAPPTDSTTALHITQSYSGAETLEHAAEVLRQALDKQPLGVFVDFNPADRQGGRPAVTYRELRIAREIRWTVVLDGSTRISIGCQSQRGRPDTIAQPCAQAIETAHEMSGTESDP